MSTILFLGGGRITGAIIAGLLLGRYKGPIIVYDRNPGKLRQLKRAFKVTVERDLNQGLSRAEILIVAVRPGSVAGLLNEVAQPEAAIRSKVVISLAAGVPFTRLRARLGSSPHLVRAMPSPVCRIGRGLTALAFDEGISAAQKKEVRDLFRHVGAVLEISEASFDAFTVAYSPSHGYHALATLARSAQAAGLDRRIALTAAAHALSGGIDYWRESGQKLEDLLREAATPGGTAAATIGALNRAGYERIIARGLFAGIQQARVNAKP